VWFNQLHIFHPSTISESYRKYQVKDCEFTDGTPIPNDVVAEVVKILTTNEKLIAWETSDLLLLDNYLYAHGRRPFDPSEGRKLLVALC